MYKTKVLGKISRGGKKLRIGGESTAINPDLYSKMCWDEQ